MEPSVLQINRKSETKKEFGLPKYPVNKAKVSLMGIDGDFNRFRSKKKNNDPKMALLPEVLLAFELRVWITFLESFLLGPLDAINCLMLEFISMTPGLSCGMPSFLFEFAELGLM